MSRLLPRGHRAARWIENFCLVPRGYRQGERVQLDRTQREMVRRLYDGFPRPQDILTGDLAAYLVLLHTCGPEAKQAESQPLVEIDSFTVWRATSPALRQYLQRDGEVVQCPELGTRWSAAAT